ncbi:MAG: hypothetical protein IJV75_06540 [Alphaproteobacteria bacterium]|nr:hypothetical protein [Alphaproteobacteria bacterium]
MDKILALTCGVLMLSSIAFADDTVSETCANGAGTVITGAVTGHKYCMSNKTMNWWNANAWCDALGRRLVDKIDCACDNITVDCSKNKCPDLTDVYPYVVAAWTVRTSNSTHADRVELPTGEFAYNVYAPRSKSGLRALCY